MLLSIAGRRAGFGGVRARASRPTTNIVREYGLEIVVTCGIKMCHLLLLLLQLLLLLLEITWSCHHHVTTASQIHITLSTITTTYCYTTIAVSIAASSPVANRNKLARVLLRVSWWRRGLILAIH